MKGKEPPTLKFLVVKEQRNSTTEQFHLVKEQRTSNTEICFCKGATELQYTNFELNKILIQREARERAKTLFHTKNYLLLQSVITKSQ